METKEFDRSIQIFDTTINLKIKETFFVQNIPTLVNKAYFLNSKGKLSNKKLETYCRFQMKKI